MRGQAKGVDCVTDHEEPDNNREASLAVLRKVTPYLWPKNQSGTRLRIVFSIIFLILARLVAVASPLYFGAAVDALDPTTDRSPTVLLLSAGAMVFTLAYGFARLAEIGFNQLRDVVFAKVGARALRKLALETFEHIHALSLRYHITRKTGGLSRIIERGVKGVEFLLRFLLFSIGPLLLQVVMILGLLLFKFSAVYALVIIVTMVAYMWFTFRITEWRVRIRKRMNDLDTEANQKAIDSLLNFETVKYFAAEKWEAARYDASMEGYEKASLKTSYSLALLNFGQAVIINLGLVVVMVMAAREVLANTLSVGDFVVVNALIIQITMPLNFLGTVYREIRQALIDMSEMFTLLEQPAEIKDQDGAPPLKITKGKIKFENVQFGYSEDRQILHGLDIALSPGQTLAVVGPSGSGKSTIGRLLFRFYDVWSGAILLDDQDIRGVTQHSLHQSIGIVPQDTVLFNDTIGYNIAYGRNGASQEAIVSAAKAAQIHDFVMGLPEGYQTQVGERGLKLSGGEKQRVGIARTLLKDPPILLLDEATSALDSETERDIQTALQDMGRGRTVITIAHRLSTIIESDQIVVLEAGRVVEKGTHRELLSLDGRYAALWHTQALEGEEEAGMKEASAS